jgi:glucose-fructose oxidoreductase
MDTDPANPVSSRPRKTRKRGKIRYAVVGLGHIAQAAVLPAFANAKRNSVLTALVSDDPTKLRELSERYGVQHTYTYDEYDACLSSGEIDAVYIALPNTMHCEYAVRAAEAGIHVLCEKPMATTEEECQKMIHAAEASGVRLMIAYRLHFEAANLRAIEVAQSGQLGDVRVFQSLFTLNVKAGNIRLDQEMGGGTLWDIGVYCINAARYLFQDEPIEVFAFSANSGEQRFAEVDEMSGALLRFPNERLASFVTSFGVAEISSYRLVGSKGDLLVEPAYDYAGKLVHKLTVDGKTTKKSFSPRDQFAPELIYFSECIKSGREPEPSGWEGLADTRIVEALYQSAATGQPVALARLEKRERPTLAQEIHEPPVKEPDLVHVEAPQPS